MPDRAQGPLAGRPRDRLLAEGARSLSDAELLALLLGRSARGRDPRAAALGLLEVLPLPELAWAPPDAIGAHAGVGAAGAVAIAAAFELGRRGGWRPPRRGERCLDPRRVFELMRHAAHAEREGFHVILLDVRGRLLRAAQVAEGSLAQCPVSPRDALRPAVREGAHSIVLCHNHPSGVMRSTALRRVTRAHARRRAIRRSFGLHNVACRGGVMSRRPTPFTDRTMLLCVIRRLRGATS